MQKVLFMGDISTGFLLTTHAGFLFSKPCIGCIMHEKDKGIMIRWLKSKALHVVFPLFFLWVRLNGVKFGYAGLYVLVFVF
jgi:hypothetical protein